MSPKATNSPNPEVAMPTSSHGLRYARAMVCVPRNDQPRERDIGAQEPRRCAIHCRLPEWVPGLVDGQERRLRPAGEHPQ